MGSRRWARSSRPDTHPPGAIPILPWRPLLDLVEQPDLMMDAH